MILRLELNPEVASPYKNFSKIAGVLTETWAKENLYCVACPSDHLSQTKKGTKVVDFLCSNCGETYQLKSKSHPFGSSVTNSAYEPKIRAIRDGTIPNFLFLRYDRKMMKVLDLFLVPRHFITESIIERRRPLSESARRRGWVGSKILLTNLPSDARIPIIEGGQVSPVDAVRNMWKRFLFMREQSAHSRGWMADVLACVRELGKEKFTLTDVYSFERRLAALHPKNRHIRPKIRQQLQVLRYHGIVEFLGRGRYRVVSPSEDQRSILSQGDVV